jgi:hypothetical protein
MIDRAKVTEFRDLIARAPSGIFNATDHESAQIFLELARTALPELCDLVEHAADCNEALLKAMETRVSIVLQTSEDERAHLAQAGAALGEELVPVVGTFAVGLVDDIKTLQTQADAFAGTVDIYADKLALWEKLARESVDGKTPVCGHCFEPHAEGPDMQAHLRVCPKNPLVAELERLRAGLLEIAEAGSSWTRRHAAALLGLHDGTLEPIG